MRNSANASANRWIAIRGRKGNPDHHYNRLKGRGFSEPSPRKGLTMQTRQFGLLTTTAVLLGCTLSWACDCAANPPPKEALKKATAVFSAKVVKIEEAGLQRSVSLEVLRAWKGVEEKKLVVSTAKSSASCGYAFQEGKTYLIYAYQEDKAPMLRVSQCSRTQTLDKAEGDLKELGEGKAVVEKGK